MTRGFIIGATAGRTTLTGEGLQHADGHSPLLAGTNPAVVTYDPAYGYEIGHIVRDGLKRMYGGDRRDNDPPNVMYYMTVYNEPISQPADRRNSTSRASSGASTCWHRPRSTARARRSSPPACRCPGPSRPSGSSPTTGASPPMSGP